MLLPKQDGAGAAARWDGAGEIIPAPGALQPRARTAQARHVGPRFRATWKNLTSPRALGEVASAAGAGLFFFWSPGLDSPCGSLPGPFSPGGR